MSLAGMNLTLSLDRDSQLDRTLLGVERRGTEVLGRGAHPVTTAAETFTSNWADQTDDYEDT